MSLCNCKDQVTSRKDFCCGCAISDRGSNLRCDVGVTHVANSWLSSEQVVQHMF